MIRNRVRWGYGLLALLLTLSTVACGGDEPAPVVQPPAPPPAPPPFQPQAVEVALGESGNVTLMTTEDGGFTLNGEAFESGGTVAAENGNMYLLTLADGKWSAAYQASEAMVTLGITEETVTLTKGEDGSYMIGEMAVTSGETMVTATNGNMYTLSMDEDGMWMATYVEPVQNVMLGTHGGSAMVKKSEDGSYWLGDMTVMNGSVVSGEGGREYTLMMGEDGMWMATFVEHVQTVMLGTHGGSTMVKKSEDGSYWVGDMTVMNGSTVSGEGGRTYTLMMGDDGMWMATFVEHVDTVMLGMSGSSVMIKKSEDGSYWIGDQTVMSGATTTAMYMGNTNTYTLTQDADGHWSASYMPEAGTVAIGASGLSIPAMRAEGGAWSAVHPLTGETVMLTEGGTVTAMNTAGYTNTYVLSSDGGTMWTAAYQSVMVPVMLGTSGDSATLTRAENGSYWHDGDAFESGGEVMAENGNDYVLTYADGSWSAMFRPDSMEVKGAGIMVFTREDDDMYDIESAGSGNMLAATGTGNVTTSTGAMYRVRKMDGMLTGVRYDSGNVEDTRHRTIGLAAHAVLIGEDRDTDAIELNTKLTVAGENISLGDLMGTGMAAKAAKAADGAAGEFVKSAVDALTDLRTEAELYAKYQAAAEDLEGRSAFDERLTSIALRAQAAVDMIFGNIGPDNKKQNVTTSAPNLPGEFNTDGDGYTAVDAAYVRATQTVRGLNRLLDALSSADAFVEATKDGANGVFENALGADAARDAYSANKSEFTAYFGMTENTRYGAIALKKRVSTDPDATTAEDGTDAEAAAIYGTRFAFDGRDTTVTDDAEDVGEIGAFSYSRIADTLRARNLPQTGGALYTGGTIAATPGGTLYRGDMRIDVNFRLQTVFGRVSELKDKDNNLWQYLDADVATIYLPKQTYDNLTQFGGMGGEDPKRVGDGPFGTATVVYADAAGFSTPTQMDTKARFAGRFIGGDGGEITGTWSLGDSARGDGKSNDLDVIYGSYGVTRDSDAAISAPLDGTAGGAVKTTVMYPATDATATPAILASSFEGDKDAAGILRLGKRSNAGGATVNNDFELKKIFAKPGADPKKTQINSRTHVQAVVAHIEQQRKIYVIYADQVGGDDADHETLANRGRQSAWHSINKFVKDHIYNVTVADQAADAAPGDTADTAGARLGSPLGSVWYPMTRNSKPDDDEALRRIDALLAAFADKFAFEDANEDNAGGVFDSQPALELTAVTDDPYPLDSVASSDAGYAAEPLGDIFGRISSQTQLFSLSTDYTRFGVWFRRETESAVHDWANHASPDDGADTPADTGSTSPGSYAYSWLSQSSYRTDRDVHTYPGNGTATYEGRTLATLKNTHIYVGDALIRVEWKTLDRTSDPVSTESTVLPIFSNFRKWQDKSLDRLMHGGKVVDEIVFRGTGGTDPLEMTATEGKLSVMVADAQVTVTYTDGTDVQLTDAGSFNAKFVGSSSDGPLGILGAWEAPGIGGATSTANDLVGAFGADLTDFETLLP